MDELLTAARRRRRDLRHGRARRRRRDAELPEHLVPRRALLRASCWGCSRRRNSRPGSTRMGLMRRAGRVRPIALPARLRRCWRERDDERSAAARPTPVARTARCHAGAHRARRAPARRLPTRATLGLPARPRPRPRRGAGAIRTPTASRRRSRRAGCRGLRLKRRPPIRRPISPGPISAARLDDDIARSTRGAGRRAATSSSSSPTACRRWRRRATRRR